MKISPISFGRAIKVNSSERVADAIATAANVTNYGLPIEAKEDKSLQRFSETIFNDTYLPNGKAKVIALAPGEIYIFSGKEAETATKITRQTSAQIDENNAFVNGLPDRYCRAEQREKYGRINQHLIESKNKKLAELAENGQDNGRKSQIDVEIETPDEFFGLRPMEKIKKIIYTSTTPNIEEQIVYNKTK
jgi:hypothetical protein